MNQKIMGDKDVQRILGTVLRVGVLLSTVIVLIGGILYLSGCAAQPVAFGHFDPEATPFTSLPLLWAGLQHADGLAIIQLGVLLLIFTPIARIILSVFSFLLEKDYMYVLIGLLVLAIIMVSLYLDIAH